MRILHVISSLAPRYGGPSVACTELCRALGARGHETSVFTTNIDGPGVLDVPLGTPVTAEGVTSWYFPVQRPRTWVVSLPLAVALRRAVPAQDVVHIHSLFLFPTAVAALLCRRFGVPYVMRPHGTLDPFLRRRHRNRKWLYTALIERRNLDGAAAIHFTTEEERELAGPAGLRARSVVVPLGVRAPADIDTDGPADPGREMTVLFLGRLNFKKGLDVLIPAFAQVARRIPAAHLVVAGADNEGYERRVRGWVAAHGLDECVTFAGLLGGSDKWQALREAAVLVLPSYTENFGLVVVEAMAAGVPVVISDRVNVWREVKAAGAGLVVPPECDALARALATVLQSSPDERARMGAAGRQLVRGRYTWDGAAGALERVYAEVGRVGVKRRPQDDVTGAESILRAPLGG